MGMFPDPPDARTNVTPRTETGAEGARFPAGSNTERHVTLSACRGCAKETAHGSPCAMIGISNDFGKTRTEGMPATELITVEHVQALAAMVWLLGYVCDGVPYQNFLYNLGAGTANNLTQQVTYEVRAVGGTLTLYGPNPSRIFSPRSVVNAAWPDEAPSEQRPPYLTDEQWDVMKWGRIISGGDYHALPAGSLVYFEFPSVLNENLFPYITRVEYPTSTAAEVEFVVHLSHNASSAMRPYDLAHPPARYFATIYYYYVAPEGFLNHQAQPEQQYSPGQKRVAVADLEGAGGIVELTRSDGTSSRVLAETVRVRYMAGILAEYGETLDLQQTWGGLRYETLLDLSALLEVEGLEFVVVDYWAESCADDEVIVPSCKTCINDQIFPGESGRRCTDTRCAKFVDGDYLAGNCWETPTADRFNSGRLPIVDGMDNSRLASLWNRLPVFIEQSMAGESSYRNFSFGRPGLCGASLASMVGGYFDQVPSGMFPTRRPMFLPSLGQLRMYDDEEGRHAELIHGLYEARTNRLNEAGDAWVDLGYRGALSQFLAGWGSRHGMRGQVLDEVAGLYPLNAPPARGLYTYQCGADGTGNIKRLSAGSHRMYASGLWRDLVDAEIDGEIREALGI